METNYTVDPGSGRRARGWLSLRPIGSLAICVTSFLTVASSQSTAPTSEKERAADARIPEWAADARWYYVSIPRFRNGDPNNDPEGAVPWSTQWPTTTDAPAPTAAEVRHREYGGDLRGVVDRLPYLKELGVNALCLSPVFQGISGLHQAQVDLRHVDDSIGVPGGFSEVQAERADPKTWVWTASDRLLLELIERAHENGLRVTISGLFYAVTSANSPPAELESYYLAATRRWLDPNGDGNPSDGVDGWLHSLEEKPLKPFDPREKAFWRRWRETVKQVNPNAVVIGSGLLAPVQTAEGPFDIAIRDSLAGTLPQLLGVKQSATADDLFKAIEFLSTVGPQSEMTNLNLLSGVGLHPRLLTALSDEGPPRKGRSVSPGPLPNERAWRRWELATMVHHCAPGAPITYYGDEVGVFGGARDFSQAPMWWEDAVAPWASALYRRDFYDLVQWLHQFRDAHPALRRGAFRRFLADEHRKLFAFGRILPEEEVVVLVNFGEQAQEVSIPAAQPGRSARLLSPPVSFHDAATMEKSKAGSAKVETDLLDSQGHYRLKIEPVSARVLVIPGKAP